MPGNPEQRPNETDQKRYHDHNTGLLSLGKNPEGEIGIMVRDQEMFASLDGTVQGEIIDMLNYTNTTTDNLRKAYINLQRGNPGEKIGVFTVGDTTESFADRRQRIAEAREIKNNLLNQIDRLFESAGEIHMRGVRIVYDFLDTLENKPNIFDREALGYGNEEGHITYIVGLIDNMMKENPEGPPGNIQLAAHKNPNRGISSP